MILVTGGTGFLGQHLLKELCSQNQSVRAIYRGRFSGIQRKLKKVEWVEGNVLDIGTLEDAMEGVTEIYHCAAIVSFDKADKKNLFDVNVEGTTNIVNLALEQNIKKLVYVSSIAALGKANGKILINEDNEWKNYKKHSDYSLSKYLAEKEVWRGIAEGLNAVIINPSVIIGEGDWDKGTPNIFKIVDNRLKYYTTGHNGFVDVKDVVRAMITFMKSDIISERFIVSAQNIYYKTLIEVVAQQLGAEPPSIKIDRMRGELLWRLSKFWSLISGSKTFITEQSVNISTTHAAYDNYKIKNKIGFEFAPIEKTIERVAKVYLSQSK